MSYIVEREVYVAPTIVRKTMNTLEDWKEVKFESSIGKTPEFIAFARVYRAWIKKEASRHGIDLLSWSNGHFECSAFFRNKNTGKVAYFSGSDVRYFPDSWHSEILVRTAKHEKDYTGGQNNSATLETVGTLLAELTA